MSEDNKDGKGFVGKAIETAKEHPVATAVAVGGLAVLGGWILHRVLKKKTKDAKKED